MKKTVLIILFIPFFVCAQKSKTPFSDNKYLEELTSRPDAIINSNRTFNSENLETDINNFYTQFAELQNPLSKLQLLSNIQSPIGKHLFYQQYYNGVAVYGGYVKVNVNFNGEQLSAYKHLYDSRNWNVNVLKTDSSIIIPFNGNAFFSYRKLKYGNEIISDETGNILFERDLKFYYTNDDTLVKAMVFLPDPLTSAGVIYGQNGTYKHFNDSDYALLNDQRVQVYFPATLRGDTFYLENKYCILQNIPETNTTFGWANINPLKSIIPDFSFTRKQNGFKEAMVMYHIYNTQKYIQSIGFNNIVNYQLRVDAQRWSHYDNSGFWPYSDTTLSFGLGGVPDAEDADVVVHEYTHAISYSINPSGNMSNERRSIEEGICDANATNYSRFYSPFNWRYCYNFDGGNPSVSGSNELWGGRTTNSTKIYLDKVGDWYGDCEIWSSTINDMSACMGRDTTLKLLFTSLYSYTPNTTMPDAANLFLQADSIIYNKYNTWKIKNIFTQRHILNFPAGIETVEEGNSFIVYNSSGFANNAGDLEIELNTKSTLTIFNIKGQIVKEMKDVCGSNKISPAAFENGFYFMKIENEKSTQTIKLIRY